MSKLEQVKNIHPVTTVKKVSNINRFVPGAVSRKVSRQILVGQKHSPTILFATGVVGVVATTVMACRATLKAPEVLEGVQKDVLMVKEAAGLNREDYTQQDYRRDLTIVYLRGTVKLVKLYGPAFVMGVTSIGALAGAHNILSKRNLALTAAYAGVEKAFDEYRQRVINEFGEDKERELRYSAEERTIVEDTKHGPQKKQIKHVGVGGGSPYARFFDSDNKNWQPTPEYNVMFLRCVEQYANDRLRTKGHVFLNEVYDDLGLERTPAGQIVGWLWKGDGDNRIDLGIWSDKKRDRFFDFVVGREGSILLDFNVDGPVYEQI